MRFIGSSHLLLGYATLGVTAIDTNQQVPIQDSATKGCATACSDLAASYPKQLLIRNTTLYDDFIKTYWSKQQQDISPLCAFKPADANEVAVLVRLAKQTECPFAIRSGGHGMAASNVNDGISVSLENLNEITVSADKKTVNLGPGNIWSKVFETLEKDDIAVAGGRFTTVGVGGLITGGGISFFAPKMGWTCNTVVEYELVDPNGKILEVTKSSHPDLFWALCGAASNFGIVTRFTLETFPLPRGEIWGGMRISTEGEIPALLQASYNFGTKGVASDPEGAHILTLALHEGHKLGLAILSHANPESLGGEAPKVMKEFLDLPTIRDSTGVRTVNNLLTEMSYGELEPRRRKRSTATYRLDLELMHYTKDVCYEEFAKLSDIPNALTLCVFQIITKQQLEVSAKKGGNPLGLEPEDGPLLLLNTWFTWDDESFDARIEQAARIIVEKSVAFSKGAKRDVDYRYLNYAGEWQNVIASYGAKNLEKLAAVAEKYDAEGVIKTLRPAIFSLAGAPIS
ncbi:hypothetical protein B0T16DRAFT_497794 [Cercophora newfieldiana]|uniref:FAD-binding PCMH-type domain-containing protein n=1 Tax=Cercophora newfieldiana TaxID=92897 RepID=A0AA39XVE9_9PEZI|nr:hypothetical protein B0T16DRAFT_497794 [Cercophora newfieldiana]